MSRDKRRDILTAMPRKNPRRILLAVLIFAALAVLVLLNSCSGLAVGGPTPLATVSHVHALTPTAEPQEGSTAGSTDGIMWMGVAIVAIILVPVVLRLITLTKS
jgi:uncharacterized RDD family membrane protein YckC